MLGALTAVAQNNSIQLGRVLMKAVTKTGKIDWEEFDVRAHGDKVQLWCDGLKVDSSTGGQSHKKRKRTNSDNEDSEDDHPKKKSAREEREDKLKQAVIPLLKNMVVIIPKCSIEYDQRCMPMVCTQI